MIWLPIILTLWNSVVYRQVPPFLANEETEWEGFREDIENSIIIQVPINFPYQLEEEVHNFVTILQKAAWNNTLIYQKRGNGINCTVEIHEMINKKRKARKRWQFTRSNDKSVLLNKLGN